VLFPLAIHPHTMPKVLILFAHPALERSRVNQVLIEGVGEIPNVHFHDLYQHYPDFYVDVQHEQELLLMHDIIIWQHPLYWYSVPPLLKQWIDLTLEHGWAYGSNGVFLKGKTVLSVITAGGGHSAYEPGGYKGYTMHEFLRPLEQTAKLCGMDYLPPYLIHGTHRIDEAGAVKAQKDYHTFLGALGAGELLPEELKSLYYANDHVLLNPVK
jgi:glutathione-regulated potassium-efflux system ancillary protein KefG